MTKFKFFLFMLKRQVAFVLVGLMLSACATPAPMHWYKEGATAEQFAKDNAACRFNAEVGSPAYVEGSGFALLALQAQMQERKRQLYMWCMQSKGYTRIDRTEQDEQKLRQIPERDRPQ
jgi:hypothetical protein